MLFAFGKNNQFPKNTCFKQHCIFGRPIGCFVCFSYFQTFMFFRPPEGAQTTERRDHFGSPFFRFEPPQIPKGPIPIPTVGPKEPIPEFWSGPKGSEQASHPVLRLRGDSRLARQLVPRSRTAQNVTGTQDSAVPTVRLGSGWSAK